MIEDGIGSDFEVGSWAESLVGTDSEGEIEEAAECRSAIVIGAGLEFEEKFEFESGSLADTGSATGAESETRF